MSKKVLEHINFEGEYISFVGELKRLSEETEKELECNGVKFDYNVRRKVLSTQDKKTYMVTGSTKGATMDSTSPKKMDTNKLRIFAHSNLDEFLELHFKGKYKGGFLGVTTTSKSDPVYEALSTKELKDKGDLNSHIGNLVFNVKGYVFYKG